MTDFHKTCYVSSAGHIQSFMKIGPHTYVVCCHQLRIFLLPILNICSDWLITKKANIQNSVWATVTTLGMWVVVGTSTSHMVLPQRRRWPMLSLCTYCKLYHTQHTGHSTIERDPSSQLCVEGIQNFFQTLPFKNRLKKSKSTFTH